MYNRQAGIRGGFRQTPGRMGLSYASPIEEFQQRTNQLRHNIPDTVLLQQVVEALRGEVEGLNGRVVANESKSVQIQDRLTKEKEELSDQLKAVRDKSDLQSACLKRFFESIHVLQSFFMDIRPSAVEITIQRQLDDARFSLADGFMKVFPVGFKAEDVMNEFDSTAKTLEWDKFMDKVNAHYWLHVSPDSGEKGLYQLRSVFGICNRAALLAIGNSAPPKWPEESLVATPNPQLFEGTYIADFDSNMRRPRGDSRNDFLTRQLRLFIPAFVWAFNELKKALLQDDTHIRSLRSMIALQLWHMNDVKGILQPAPASFPEGDTALRFVLGTGLELRRGEYWKKILGAARSEVTSGNRGGEGLGAGANHVLNANTNAEEHGNVRAVKMTQSQSPKPESAGSSIAAGRKRRAGGSDADSEEDESRLVHKPWKGSDAVGTSPTTINLLPPQSSSSQPTHVALTQGKYGSASVVDLMIQNAKTALAGEERNLEAAIERRKDHLDKFNCIHKCLAILVDENLMKLVVFGRAVVRKVADRVVRKKFDYDSNIDVALKRVQDLIDEFSPDEEFGKGIDIQAGSKKLEKLVYESDDYFVKQGVSVEQAVDEYLNGETIHTNALEADTTQPIAKTDLHVLMSWLQVTFPAV